MTQEQGGGTAGRTMTYAESRARFEERRTRYEAEREREIEELRRAGEEPATEHDDWEHVGFPGSPFSAHWRYDGAVVELRLSGFRYHPPEGYDLLGMGYPRRPARFAADDLVRTILRVWPELSAPYEKDGDGWWPERIVLEFPGHPPIALEREAGWLRTVVDDVIVDDRTHSVLIVECLRALCDHVVDRGIVSEDAARLWRAASDAVDLPRFPVDPPYRASDEESGAIERRGDEVVLQWHLRNSGMDAEAWRLAALDHAARSDLADRAGTEQASDDEMDYGWRTTASRETVDRLVGEAAAARAIDRDAFERDALSDRLSWARAEIYRRDQRRRDAFLARANEGA